MNWDDDDDNIDDDDDIDDDGDDDDDNNNDNNYYYNNNNNSNYGQWKVWKTKMEKNHHPYLSIYLSINLTTVSINIQ